MEDQRNNFLEESAYQEPLMKYAKAYQLKKSKNNQESLMVEDTKRYVIYARKSTEDDKRQVQSIEDQLEHCEKFAKMNNLMVGDIIRDEKSARTAGKRDGFTEMMNGLKDGTNYNSILAWHPDRLARNMKDSGEILDLLDKGVIRDLKFTSYTFNNDAAGKMTLSILFAMAKEFSDKLSEDTKRGVSKKVREGKYCGSKKRGYLVRSSGNFRADPDTFDIYKSAWKEYLEGKSQREIIKMLKQNDIDISEGKLSIFFQDPFYAGLYCYGNQIIDIKKVDPRFPIMVSAKEFLQVQRENRNNPSGWHLSSEFRPFNGLVICGDCGHFLTAGLSSGNRDKYLNISCGNSKCRARRKEKGIRPIANSIRGRVIIDLALSVIAKLDTTKEIYEKAKQKYLESRNTLIKGKSDEIKLEKSHITKLENKSEALSEKLLAVKEEEVIKKFSHDIGTLCGEIKKEKKALKGLEIEKANYESEIEMEFPNYEDFVNFFKKASDTLKTTQDDRLIDQIVKLIFVNMKVDGKEVLCYSLREPFSSYEIMKFQYGVL